MRGNLFQNLYSFGIKNNRESLKVDSGITVKFQIMLVSYRTMAIFNIMSGLNVTEFVITILSGTFCIARNTNLKY